MTEKNSDRYSFQSQDSNSGRREFLRKAGLGGLWLSALSSEAMSQNSKIQTNTPSEAGQLSAHWNLFDAHVTVGRHLKLRKNGLHTAEDLLAEMDHYGIAEALVVDSLSRENHPKDGNRRILEVTKSSPRLHRGWSAMPSGIKSEQLPPYDFVNEMTRQQVGALFLYPNQYFFNLSDWSIDALLEPIAASKVPVFINPVESNGKGGSDATDWDGVVALCKRWPSIPVIISENRIRRSQRLLYKALDACPNLHLELSAYWLHRGIEYITERWGAKRLLFGSGWPNFGQHMTLATLTTAEISDQNKRLIAGDNLRELLSWNKPKFPVVNFPAAEDEFVEFGRSGVRPDTMTFYDVHGHLGENNAHYHVPNSNIKEVISDMDRLGLNKVCVMSFAGVYSDEVFGNDIVAKAAQGFPDRFVGFTLLNPNRGKDEMLKELQRGASMGMRGIKLIPTYQGYPVEGSLIDVACEWANKHHQIIINHYWGSPTQMERLVKKYPNACFVTAHTTTEYADIMKRYPNLFVCSVPLLSPRACEEVVDAIGADRLLFGTDLLDLPIAWNLGPIIFARISAKEKSLILGENLKKILNEYSLPK
jgi:predicted TIM-barrel fold metal-dependent hydrolase